MDFTDFLTEEAFDDDSREATVARDLSKPTCPECHLMLPVTGVCC